MLQNLGYTVTGTTSSLEAFNLFYSSPDHFDLLISDFTMPKMTGAELIERVKQRYARRFRFCWCQAFTRPSLSNLRSYQEHCESRSRNSIWRWRFRLRSVIGPDALP